MRHYSLWPFSAESACGAEEEFQTTELGWVSCRDCRRIVVEREIEGSRGQAS